MGHVSNSFKAIREWDKSLLILFFIGEPLKNLLIFTIFIVQLYLHFLNRCFLSFIFRKILHLKLAIDKNELFIRIACQNALKTWLVNMYLGISRTFPIFFKYL
jgi:hypothetical protein